MTKSLAIYFLIIISSLSISAQEYDQAYFNSPVKHNMRLSGSFAELRTNHFHMGIDIKSTNGRSGDPILAAADGVISRINVDASGYGNALYIDHNNGYTTVYAHLSAFSDNIAAHIKTEQYKTKSFQQQLYPDSLFLVKKGDVIGLMGNTGKSFGPHLHFEIRETKSETPVNPFLWGLKPNDQRPPVFEAIKFYKTDTTGKLSVLLEKKVKLQNKGIYTIDQELIKLPADQIAISAQVYDQMDGAYNKNGVYRMKLLVDDKVQHGYRLDKVSYEEGHFINSFIDYGEKQKSKRQFSNCFTHPVDDLSIYEHKPDRNGKIKLNKDKPTDIKIVLQDFHGNESELSFKIVATDNLSLTKDLAGNYTFDLNDRNIVRLKNTDIIFEEGSFVDNKQLQISEGLEKIDDFHLPILNIGNSETPLFKPYKLYIKGIVLPDSLKSHFCVVKCDKPGQTAYRGEWQDSIYAIELNELGVYQCSLDRILPKIKPINLKHDMSKESSIKFKITDNFNPASKKDRLKYQGTIDGKWVLFEYDLKNELIFYKFDEKCPLGEHKFTLFVYDNRGNENSFKYQFSRF